MDKIQLGLLSCLTVFSMLTAGFCFAAVRKITKLKKAIDNEKKSVPLVRGK